MNPEKNQMALFTDLYELTMAASYFEHSMFAPATFSLFIRKYPPDRAYFVSAGLEQVLEYLENFKFEQEGLDYLASQGLFSDDFLDYLGRLRFTGDVWAIPEGRVFFKNEPVVEVTAPIIEGQLVETFIINAINLQVSIATKASRCVHAARGRKLVDFSLRRTQGIDAGLKVARASYLAGFEATSNVLSGKLHDIPISGTMAHSFVTSFKEEIDAFWAFFETFPENTVLLIDTYDTVEGAKKAVSVAKEMKKKGYKLKGVRLDSGDMAQLSKEVREIFDQEGLDDVKIFASGGFDEHKISDVIDRGCKIDAFGIGTKMGVSADGPYTDIAYKLVEYDGRPVLKLSSGKKTLVSKKQVFRTSRNGKPVEDFIALRDEEHDGEKLLKSFMTGGRRESSAESLKDIRKRFSEEFSTLDEGIKSIDDPKTYPVHLSDQLEDLQEDIVENAKQRELGESS